MLDENFSVFRSVLIGDQSLLIRCAEILVSQGHKIEAVISKSDDILEWCQKNSIESVSPDKDYSKELAQIEFDYLFSITNLQILPQNVLKLPRQAAINFHDGPLPDYAGLNTPVWALLNDAVEYGITWHVMTTTVDKGGILKQKFFPIDSDETAFSLNTKCYEAGADVFTELVKKLPQNKFNPVKQTRELKFYARNQRPEAACLVDWSQPAQKIITLVNALNYGPYYNPMGIAKIYLGSSIFLTKSAKIEDDPGDIAETLPGTILAVDEHTLTIKCADCAVSFSDLFTQAGKPLDIQNLLEACSLKPGAQLPPIPPEFTESVTELNREICVSDEFWIEQLNKAVPIEIPRLSTEKDSGNKNAQFNEVSIDIGDKLKKINGNSKSSNETIVSILILLLGRLNNCADNFDIAYSNERLKRFSTDESLVFATWVPLHVDIDYQRGFSVLLENCRQQIALLDEHQSYTHDLFARSPELSQASSCDQYPIACVTGVAPEAIDLSTKNNFQNIFVINPDQITLISGQDSQQVETSSKLLESFSALIDAIASEPDAELFRHNFVSDADKNLLLNDWLAGPSDNSALLPIHEQFEQQVVRTPTDVAIVFEGDELSYTELNHRANQLATLLLEEGAKAEDRIGVLIDRSQEMMISLLAVLKTGCAYVPLDPTYPGNRLNYMIQDSNASIVITQQKHLDIVSNCQSQLLILEDVKKRLRTLESSNLNLDVANNSLAYVIYTSGSTGKPKGVMVEHCNVANFFLGMDNHIDARAGTWLAVTSISFDISVLELFWTLTRGFKVILYADEARQKASGSVFERPDTLMDFSLFYWNVASDESEYDSEKYRLLLESAQYGDQNDFVAVWTPERHFGAFGGLYPNPSVTSAALSTITQQIKLRGGSCVVPLHSPIRIAEEWAVVDNLSNGRVGLSIAAGWAPPDFAIKPENFANAKDIMFENVEIIKRLWRGETVEMPGPNKPVSVRTLPRPIQAELPIWVTTAGNIDTFLKAAEIGGNILTHLLGQTPDEVAEKITEYRKAWKEHGHPGEGYVSLLLHTFVGLDMEVVKEQVREPMKNYLKSAMFLVKDAAWQFPTFKKFSEEQGKTMDDFFETISDDDMDALLEFAFQRYFGSSGLFGTPESCLDTVAKLKQIGVNEIGCLIDFGMDTDTVLESLPNLNTLRKLSNNKLGATETCMADSIPALIEKYEVSHLQCTPSMATMLSVDPESKQSFTKLKQLMIGGEAFPPELANQLVQLDNVRVSNMYGPTETTIWSSVEDIDHLCERTVPIGRPITETQIYVLDKYQQLLPIGVPGEIVIGGKGVVRGYYNRESLTIEKFVPDTFSKNPDSRLYRTGDLARYNQNGVLDYLGRIDQQVKIRGYRIELGEIEAVLRDHESVKECAVILREDSPGDQRLTAYVTPGIGQTLVPTILRKYISRLLPDFMVPSSYISLNQLPLTLNGKIDRNSLAEAATGSKVEHRIIEPETDAEEYLASLWQQVLDSDQISTADNFFEAGGHSLLAVQVVAQVKKETGIAIPLATMVINTLGQIAAQKFPANWQLTSQLEEFGSEGSKSNRGQFIGRLLKTFKR